MLMEKTPKNAKKYSCKKCAFECCKMSDYTRHLLTAKHKMLTNANEKTPKNTKAFMCSCGKIYKQAPSLTRHKKICLFVINSTEDNELDKNNNKIELEKEVSDKDRQIDTLTNAVHTLIDENKSLTKMVVEQKEETNKILEKISDNMGSKTINNVNTINMNYNINVFLNEQCKDAMSLMDFVDTIKCKLKDLENIGKLGYVDGISKLFIENLSGMDVTKRPIHCTDLKRKSLYIKNNDEWTKDNNNAEMRKAINKVASKNIKNIDKWRNENPEHHNVNGSGIKRQQYLDIVNESLVTDDDGKKGDKIIKNISTIVSIDREIMKSGELEK